MFDLLDIVERDGREGVVVHTAANHVTVSWLGKPGSEFFEGLSPNEVHFVEKSLDRFNREHPGMAGVDITHRVGD